MTRTKSIVKLDLDRAERALARLRERVMTEFSPQTVAKIESMIPAATRAVAFLENEMMDAPVDAPVSKDLRRDYGGSIKFTRDWDREPWRPSDDELDVPDFLKRKK